MTAHRKATMVTFRRCGAAALSLGVLAAVLGGIPALAGPAPAAHAETYRFWSYWQADGGSWALATKGSGSTQPADGAVEGWRFTKSSGSAGKSASPRADPSFEQICASTPAREGTKRVAVVIDYGTAKDAPKGAVPPVPRAECAQVDPDASGTEVLAAIAEERYAGSGMVCSIDGFPRGACGGAASSGNPAKSAEGDSGQPADGADGAAGGTGGTGGTDGASGDGAVSAEGGGLPLGAVLGVAAVGLLVGVLGSAALLRARRSG